MTDRSYEAPRVTTLGSLADLVQHNVDGAYTDDNFPAGTPKGDVTFSG